MLVDSFTANSSSRIQGTSEKNGKRAFGQLSSAPNGIVPRPTFIKSTPNTTKQKRNGLPSARHAKKNSVAGGERTLLRIIAEDGSYAEMKMV
jgi:hypothetical protein